LNTKKTPNTTRPTKKERKERKERKKERKRKKVSHKKQNQQQNTHKKNRTAGYSQPTHKAIVGILATRRNVARGNAAQQLRADVHHEVSCGRRTSETQTKRHERACARQKKISRERERERETERNQKRVRK
jgi:hypothetical protein